MLVRDRPTAEPIGAFEAPEAREASEIAIVAKAVLNAAERLGLSARSLGEVIGLSEASVSRLKRGEHRLDRHGKPFELSLLFIRLFRSLDAILGGDETAARAWMQSENSALGGVPAKKILTVMGLVDVLAYLDARRARL